MIYNLNGDVPINVCDVNGDALDCAYDSDGNTIYRKDIALKVMSYNVGQWYIGSGTNIPADKDAEYYALQNGMIKNANADIVCLCEYWDTFSKAGRTALSLLSQYYPYVETMGGTSGYFGRAICSKYPVTNYAHHSFANESSRYYDSATVMVNNVPITVIITHLNVNSISKRADQISELIAFLQTQDRFIACGDYNMLHCKTIEDEDYLAIMQPIINAGLHSANCTDFGFLETYSDQPTGTYTGCLDNIITSPNITITNAYVDTSKLTDGIADKVDHMPLIAEMTV